MRSKKDSSVSSSGGGGGIVSPHTEADMTSLSSLICRTHSVCLLHHAFTSSALLPQHQPVLAALHVIREHHVNAVARLMRRPLTFDGGADEVQQSFKFEGLEVALFEEDVIGACVQVLVVVMVVVLVLMG